MLMSSQTILASAQYVYVVNSLSSTLSECYRKVYWSFRGDLLEGTESRSIHESVSIQEKQHALLLLAIFSEISRTIAMCVWKRQLYK